MTRMRWLLIGGLGATLAAFPIVAYAGEQAAPALSAANGTRFLANIDDDAGACQAKARTVAADATAREAANDEKFYAAKAELEKEPDKEKAEREYLELRKSHRLEQNLADRQMAACNDAADTIVNGPADELDLARLKVKATVPSDATGTLTATGNVHLFVKRQTWELASTLSAAEMRHGVQLGLEGRDVVRDPAVWDGSSVVTLTVRGGGTTTTATVRMHEAPVITQSNTQKLQRVLLAPATDENGIGWRKDLAAVLPKNGLSTLDTGGDDWMQDVFEPAYTSMTGTDGRPHGMRVLIGSVNDMHRVAGRILFTQLAGHDVAGLHVEVVPTRDADDDNTYDSMGNLETIPPTPGHPAGQIVIGTTPAPEMLTLLRAQRAQEVITLDSSWLTIGHVDEFVQFVPALHGFTAVVADPQAGLDLLKKAPPQTLLHGGLPTLEWPYNERIDQRTAGQFLADQQFIDTNRIAAAAIAATLGKLHGVDIVRIPMLYTYKTLDYGMAETAASQLPPGPARDKAYADLHAMHQAGAEIPNPINGLLAGDHRYVAPKPFGTIVGGTDVFAAATSKAFAGLGYQVTYVDDLTSAHISEGEIHCSTNTFRAYPGVDG